MPNELIPVKFHEDTIYSVEYNGEQYTPVRPIVENIGLDWASQYTKLKDNHRWSVVIITTVAQDGVQREMVCMPVRKLLAFLATINPDKVKEEIRPKLEQYQDECDEVLWQYWSTGRATKESVESALSTSYSLEDQLKAANFIFASHNITDEMLTLALDAYFSAETGRSALKQGNVAIIPAKQDLALNVTQIGLLLKPEMKAEKVNLLLEEMGLQTHEGTKPKRYWKPTAEGLKMGAVIEYTGRKHTTNSTPVNQVKWLSSIADVLQQYIDNKQAKTEEQTQSIEEEN